MSIAYERHKTVEELFREMKLTRGGTMLMVRLQADMLGLSSRNLKSLKRQKAAAEWIDSISPGSRLGTTVTSMVSHFGRGAAIRAIVESAGELLIQRQPEDFVIDR